MKKRLNILITSGGTKVAIDDVRHIGNMSSGTFGAKIAYEALRRGHNVTFLCAKGSKTPLGLRFSEKDGTFSILKKVFKNCFDRFLYNNRLRVVEYTDFDSYESLLRDENSVGNPDAVILAAAVSDYGVVNKVNGKIRSKEDLDIKLMPLPKIISRFNDPDYPVWKKPRVLVGFKLLVNSTDNELFQAAFDSVKNNGCDLVVANDLRDIKDGKHRLVLVDSMGLRSVYLTDSSDPNYLARMVVEAFTNIEEDFLGFV